MLAGSCVWLQLGDLCCPWMPRKYCHSEQSQSISQQSPVVEHTQCEGIDLRMMIDETLYAIEHGTYITQQTHIRSTNGRARLANGASHRSWPRMQPTNTAWADRLPLALSQPMLLFPSLSFQRRQLALKFRPPRLHPLSSPRLLPVEPVRPAREHAQGDRKDSAHGTHVGGRHASSDGPHRGNPHYITPLFTPVTNDMKRATQSTSEELGSNLCIVRDDLFCAQGPLLALLSQLHLLPYLVCREDKGVNDSSYSEGPSHYCTHLQKTGGEHDPQPTHP